MGGSSSREPPPSTVAPVPTKAPSFVITLIFEEQHLDKNIYAAYSLSKRVVFHCPSFEHDYYNLFPRDCFRVMRLAADGTQTVALVPPKWSVDTFRDAWTKDNNPWYVVLPKADGYHWWKQICEELSMLYPVDRPSNSIPVHPLHENLAALQTLEFAKEHGHYDPNLYATYDLTRYIVLESSLFERLYRYLVPLGHFHVVRDHSAGALVPPEWSLETFRGAWNRDNQRWLVVLPKQDGAVWHQKAVEESAQRDGHRKMASDAFAVRSQALRSVLDNDNDEQEGQPS